jgi:hypothetical protein
MNATVSPPPARRRLPCLLLAAVLTGLACLLQPAAAAIVKVETEYGRERVTPRAGTITVPNDTEQTFDAPEFIYLNKDFKELDLIGDVNDPDPTKVAYYRARNVGYAIDGDLVQGAERFFKKTVPSTGMTVVWKWELDYAVFIEFADEDGLPFTAGNGVGNPDPVVGRIWKPKDTQFTAAVDRTAGNDPLGLDISGFRYNADSYLLNNARSEPLGYPTDQFWRFRELTGGGFNVTPSNLNQTRDGVTFAWWGKIDRKLDSKRDAVFLHLFPTGALNFAANYPELGGESRPLNSMTIGVRPDGQLFVEEVLATAAAPTGIYRELASVPSALVGFEWHHWAVAFDFPAATPTTREIRIYRDGSLVFRGSLAAAVDKPGLMQGRQGTYAAAYGQARTDTGTFRYENLEGALNNISIFYEALPPGSPKLRDHARSINGLIRPDDSGGGTIAGVVTFHPLDNSAAVFGATNEFFPADARTVLRRDKGPVALGSSGNRLVTETVNIDDWLRVQWRWSGQVRYRFDAASLDAASGPLPLPGQSFLRTFFKDNPATTGVDESLIQESIAFGNAGTNEAWVKLGRKVQVGSFYRTADRRLTLRDFTSTPSGDLGMLGSDVSALADLTITDSQSQSRVARVAPSQPAVDPSEIHFVYQPTVFRAEVPLGQSFDAINPDLRLIPALPDGAVLRAASLGPKELFTRVGTFVPDGTTTGFPVRWDQLGKRLLPVHPGSYQLEWPDANEDGESYKIEMVSGYPTDVVALSSERELPTGAREGSAPGWVMQTTLAAADPDFPASPTAHYRHRYSTDALRNPPTKLDLSGSDHWKFQEVTFTDRLANTSANVASPGVPFTARGTGRSVLLYSYRPNPDEAADGTLTDENLAVRVVRSEPVAPINPDGARNPLGRRGLELGGGAAAQDGALGVLSRSGTNIVVNPAATFALDFWLNAKSLPLTGPPVTVLTTGTNKLEVILDPAASTITARYFGMTATHPVSREGSGWSHYVFHVFGESFFGLPVTLLDFYADGIVAEDGRVTEMMPPGFNGVFTAGTTLTSNSLRLGVGAAQLGLQLDQLRLYSLTSSPLTYLRAGDVRSLRENRSTTLRANSPQLYFHFESAPTLASTGTYSFPNIGTVANLGIGPKSANDPSGLWTGLWARLDIQEVATRIDSPLDDAGFGGSGYILNRVSNYNASLYNRTAEVGTWGPLFPVNEKRLYNASANRLEVAYYENPYRRDEITHPNVAWPYIESLYDEVIYPTYGPHKDKAIYIASRIGSEGVDRNGKPQQVYDLADYAGLAIYNQPDRALPGFNPNEEHAIAAAAGRAALKVKTLGDGIPNNPPLAAFALQTNVNNLSTSSSSYTSHPWTLIQVVNRSTGQPEMAAYQVFKTRTGSIAFPRPADSAIANTGLAYESAENPEDRFLTIDPRRIYNFSYQFDYPVFAGDLLIPPYPLNLVIGNVTMLDERGGNLQVGGVNQRTLWRDVNGHAWVVSGGGRFFHQFFYPMRGDFYFANSVNPGTPVAWLPEDNVFTGTGSTLKPVKVVYNSAWRSSYPKLKRGETLTYQGGEYFNENPGSNGLPALVAMAAAEVIFDSATPSMVLSATSPQPANTYALGDYSARIIRAVDRRETPFTVAQMGTALFTPASAGIFVVAERWYFKDLPGSLQKRFYFDSLAQKLVLRGQLNDKESGDADLTAGPDPINVLEPNVITRDEYTRIYNLSSDTAWHTAVDTIYLTSQNPHGVTTVTASTATPVFLSGVRPKPAALDLTTDFHRFYSSTDFTALPVQVPDAMALDSFGTGSALVPSPRLLERTPNGSLYLTIAENNRTELDGAPVSLHIIEIVPDRYRGAIKVIEAADAFSEKITLQHNGEFGANTGDLYYEWWIRDAAPLDVVADEVLANGTLKEADAQGNSLWQQYIPSDRASLPTETAKHLGLHSIVFEGRPDVVLADKLVLMRYRHKNETAGWKLVPFEVTNPVTAWKPGNIAPVSAAPFQWAGAANSPQLQADGSKRYIPQLVMGWVKRVLDRINPYEARYSDFFSNESPAAYSSQIQIAGGPFAGKVALNPAKNVIENTGLIELYETVLGRARELSIDNSSNPVGTDGINQALLLAATRLSVLYELLAREAYSDAQDSTITVTEDGALGSVASFTHAFQGLESDLLHEELALLRGTDFRKSYPVYNRMFWNYTKGLGEAAYNVNYNVYDENTDGFINEDDARALYPQGHGDSWGHFVSAINMHYTLLQHPVFNWRSRSELYSLMQNVLEVDYLDEKTFAKLAAGRARAGRDIVRGTYRLNFTQDPSGQWQGYTDSADPARAWGVSEWAHRAGQGAYFDWAVANAILPEEAGSATPVENPENLDRIERSGAIDEIGEIAGGLYEIQTAMDEANGGVNPLGFDSDAITFDIDPTFLAVGSTAQIGTRAVQGLTHYEQIYERALTAGNNAMATLDYAASEENKLRRIADDTDALIVEALRQDLDYRNRLIEIFGRPYDGTIGVGKAYPEGYEGPDHLLYAYLNRTTVSQIIPTSQGQAGVIDFNDIKTTVSSLASDATLLDLYRDTSGGSSTELSTAIQTYITGNSYEDPTISFTMPVTRASAYAFQSPTEWGNRTSYGRIQRALEEILREEAALKGDIDAYIAFLGDFETLTLRLLNQIETIAEKEDIADEITAIRASFNTVMVAAETAIGIAQIAESLIGKVSSAVRTAIPRSIGFSNDVLAPARGIVLAASVAAREPINIANSVKDIALRIASLVRDETIAALEREDVRQDYVSEVEGMLAEIEMVAGNDGPLRAAIGERLQGLELLRQEFFTAQAEGFRLLREREAFNKILAAKVQKNRYQDMIIRLSRNEVMSKYESAFNNAARYAWLAAKAYDYETSLDPGHPAAATQLFDQIVKTRQLGLWVDGSPRAGKGGLAEILSQLNGNFQSIEGQIGLNSVQIANEEISMRGEHFRIGPPEADGGTAASDARWTDGLKARIVDDLASLPEFRQYCRPFADPAAGPQPGLVIRFSTTIQPGFNFFGRPLAGGDHAYSSAAFATRIATAGIFLDGYDAENLATTPRAYLVPIGTDYFRISTSSNPVTRAWTVRENRIPTPYVINPGQLTAPGFIPSLDGTDGSYGEQRRHSDFRMYHEPDLELDDDEQGTRLIARSIWNSDWMLVIPGAGLHADAEYGLTQFAEKVSDIKLTFKTYSHNGQ